MEHPAQKPLAYSSDIQTVHVDNLIYNIAVCLYFRLFSLVNRLKLLEDTNDANYLSSTYSVSKCCHVYMILTKTV